MIGQFLQWLTTDEQELRDYFKEDYLSPHERANGGFKRQFEKRAQEFHGNDCTTKQIRNENGHERGCPLYNSSDSNLNKENKTSTAKEVLLNQIKDLEEVLELKKLKDKLTELQKQIII